MVATFSIQDLKDSVKAAYKKLEPFRKQRESYIKEYVGNYYGSNGTKAPTPYNLFQLYVTITGRRLAPTSPRAFVQTFDRNLKPAANSLELAINRKIEDINLGNTLSKFVVEAFFGMGIIKTGLNLSGTVEIGGFNHDVSEPFVEIVEFEDFVWDLTAKTYEQVHFAGNRFTMTGHEIFDAGIFDDEALEKLSDHLSGTTTHDTVTDRANDLVADRINDEEVLKKRINLWDIWLPSENLIITFLDDDSAFPLRMIEWSGPESGPYELLRFNEVPGNIMPVPPLANLYSLHRLTNKLLHKTGRQAKRQKTIGVVRDGAGEDATKLKNAPDGEVVGVQNADSLTEHSYGGPDVSVVSLLGFTSDLFKMLGGNLDVLGGLEASAKTLGQEELLDANSNEQIKGMAKKVNEAAGNIISAIAFYLFDDPLASTQIEKTVPGVKDLIIPTTFNPMDIEAEFSDFGITISPYSMQAKTPGEQVQAVTSIVTQLAFPLQEAMAQQGLGIDIMALFKFIGDRANLPELSEIIVSQSGEPITDRDEKTTQPTPQAPITERHNFRHQVSDDARGETAMRELIGSFDSAQGGNDA